MIAQQSSVFKFRQSDHIGAADAEHDTVFLSKCFIDTGDLDVVKDLTDHRQIIIGRTGVGKTALLEKLRWEYGEQVITIDPQSLALTYVSNSTILRFFFDLGVNLEPFFKLLWRHVLTVELLRRHLPSHATEKCNGLIDILKKRFCGPSKKDREMNEAIQYLNKWGENFWEHTEFRVKEITNRVEDQLGSEAAMGLGIPHAEIKAAINTSTKMTEEQKSELIQRGQKIIAEAQVQDLSKVINLLDHVLDDRQRHYYVLIDKLDENWVEEKLRYKLIMALIQTATDFIKVKNAKVIIALRKDLVERVFKISRDSGFQEEKIRSLYIYLSWSKDKLIEVLDSRINELVTRRYTRKPVTHQNLLPKTCNRVKITEHITNIAQRPRDIISLFNECISVGAHSSRLTASHFKRAEGQYSRGRLRALGDEWEASYPALIDFSSILQNRPHSFKIRTIDDNEIVDMCLDIAIKTPNGEGVLQSLAKQVVEETTTINKMKYTLFHVFYKVGLVGIKLLAHEPASWADDLGQSISSAEISDDTSVVINPVFHRVLGTNRRK